MDLVDHLLHFRIKPPEEYINDKLKKAVLQHIIIFMKSRCDPILRATTLGGENPSHMLAKSLQHCDGRQININFLKQLKHE